MKSFLLFLLTLVIASFANCQSIQLTKGQKFSYNITEQTDLKSTVSQFSPPLEELLFKRTKLHFKVMEEGPEKYIIEASNELVDEYRRKYFTKRKTYRTTKNYNSDLISDSSEIEYDKMLFMGKVQFELLKNGRIGEFINLDTSNFNIHPIYKMRLMSFADIALNESNHISDQDILKKYLSIFFFEKNISRTKKHPIYKLDKKTGKEIFIPLNTDSIGLTTIYERYTTQGKDSIVHTYGLSDQNTSGITQHLLWKSELQEKTNYGQNVLFDYNSNNNTYDEKKGVIYTYIQLEQQSSVPFNCKYEIIGDNIKEVNYKTTNVTLKGHVKNAGPGFEVALGWQKESPKRHGYFWHKLKAKLDENNNFEIRLKLDDIQNFNFYHYGFIPIYLKPGDNVFITFDMNNIEESILATGIGSDDLNFLFKKYYFEKERHIGNYEIEKSANNDMGTLPPKKFKSQYLKTLKTKHEFLDENRFNISPELYQAIYWDDQLNTFKLLNQYPLHSYNHFKRKNLYWGKTYYNFDHLLHPDNALMLTAISPENKKFLTRHMFGQLKKNITEVSGTLFLGTERDEFTNNINLGFNYNYCELFFSGKMEYFLKYNVLLNILESGNDKLCQQYRSKFTSEYPFSEKLPFVNTLYNNLKDIFPGQKAYDFELQNLEGEKVKLSDFKNKVVYLQFIYSKNEFIQPHKEILKFSNQLKKTLNNEFEFVFVDFSKDLESTLKFMINRGDTLKGVFLLANNNVQEKYLANFRSFRTNFIIDKKGYIHTMGAPGPEELLKSPLLLNAALNSTNNPIDPKVYNALKYLTPILALTIITILILLILTKTRARQKQQLANLNTKVRELELSAIRAQMNPHFMYNCLNSIQNIILDNKPKEAHIYLSKFANLIRQTLKNSEKTEITLQEEMVMIQQYVELELLRFPIDFIIDINKNIDPYTIYIPPLLLQPLVENAILHGLSGKNGNKKLTLNIEKKESLICISITDNGIGREASAQVKKPTSGKGIGFTKERLAILSEKHHASYELNIIDLKKENGDSTGTRVEICFTED